MIWRSVLSQEISMKKKSDLYLLISILLCIFFVSGLGSILFALTIDSPEINAPISSAIPLALTSEKIKPETTPDIQPVMATNKPAACGE